MNNIVKPREILTDGEIEKAVQYLINNSEKALATIRSSSSVNHLKTMKIAVEQDEKQRFLRVSCEAKIEAWRSMSANLRSIKI